jgi:cytochrome c-type biogenesis protein CcmE
MIGLALGLVFFAMRDTIVFFHTPSEVHANGVEPGTRFRLGGLVQEGSVQRGENQMVSFRIADAEKAVSVRFRGLLPDLFREGQGVIAEGVLKAPGLFAADSVLAKHDENYMPREVANALREQGHWKDATQGPAGAP